MLKSFKLFIISILTLTLIACTSTSTRESTGEYLDSSVVTANVKARLLDQLASRGLGIQVKTYKDEVQLSGFVNSAIIRRHAGIIAANTAGVRRVRNDIIVK